MKLEQFVLDNKVLKVQERTLRLQKTKQEKDLTMLDTMLKILIHQSYQQDIGHIKLNGKELFYS